MIIVLTILVAVLAIYAMILEARIKALRSGNKGVASNDNSNT